MGLYSEYQASGEAPPATVEKPPYPEGWFTVHCGVAIEDAIPFARQFARMHVQYISRWYVDGDDCGTWGEGLPDDSKGLHIQFCTPYLIHAMRIADAVLDDGITLVGLWEDYHANSADDLVTISLSEDWSSGNAFGAFLRHFGANTPV